MLYKTLNITKLKTDRIPKNNCTWNNSFSFSARHMQLVEWEFSFRADHRTGQRDSVWIIKARAVIWDVHDVVSVNVRLLVPEVILELMVYHPETDYLVFLCLVGCTNESAAISEIRNSVHVTQCPKQRRVGKLRCTVAIFNPWHTLNDEFWLHNDTFIF